MRIYRFWDCRCETINGVTVHFKAGSNDSPEAAALLTEEKIALYRQFANGGTPEAQKASLRMKLDPAGKDINDGMCNGVFPDIVTAMLQRCHIVVDRLGRTHVWHVDFKTMSVVISKLHITNMSYTIQLCLIHASITVCLAGNMVLKILIGLMVFC